MFRQNQFRRATIGRGRGARLSCIVTLIAALSAWISDPALGGTMSLKAVSRNGAPVAPANVIQASAGDTIEAEIRMCGWADQNPDAPAIDAFASTILGGQGAQSGGGGHIRPVCWDAPMDSISCVAPSDCPPEFPVCWDPVPICVGNTFDPTPDGPPCGGFYKACEGGPNDGLVCRETDECPGGTCADRPDHPFAGNGRIEYAITGWSLDMGFYSFDLTGPSAASTNCETTYYGGTYALQVSAEACGAFTFDLLTDPAYTFYEYDDRNYVVPSVLDGLVIELPACGACCHPDRTCTVAGELFCDGGNWHSGESCGGDLCTRGACCAANGTCTWVNEEDCHGTLWTQSVTCTPNRCIPVPGARASRNTR